MIHTLLHSLAQCKPAQGQNVEIVLSKVNENCQEEVECSGMTMDEKQQVAMSAITSCGTGNLNCSVMEPQVTKVYCSKEKTPSKEKHSRTKTSKKYGDMKLKAMVVCNACTFGSEALQEHTHKTPERHRNRRAHSSSRSQQIFDSNECTVMFSGCEYSASINTKYSPTKMCGYTTMSSSTDSCGKCTLYN